MEDDERDRLLHPPWSAVNNGFKYDGLTEEDKRVWRQTRGQTTDDDAYSTWINDLANAVKAGIITAIEARTAIRKTAL